MSCYCLTNNLIIEKGIVIVSFKIEALCKHNIGTLKRKQVRKDSCRKRNKKNTPTSQAKHTHSTHTVTHMPPTMHQLVKNTRKTYIK